MSEQINISALAQNKQRKKERKNERKKERKKKRKKERKKPYQKADTACYFRIEKPEKAHCDLMQGAFISLSLPGFAFKTFSGAH